MNVEDGMTTNQKMGIIKYTPSDHVPAEIKALVTRAEQASMLAYAPYSHYKVGSALLDLAGEVFQGANQENASYPLCMCAERVALYHYSAQIIKHDIQILAVYAASSDFDQVTPPSPCGACRQVISEYQNRQPDLFKIVTANQHGHIWVFDSIQDLLPYAFRPENLLGQ